jgi:hypothetical protein
MKSFTRSCKKRVASSLSPFLVKILLESEDEVFDEDKDEILTACGSLVSTWEVDVSRVLRCRRNGVVLTSEMFDHRGLVNDSYVMLDNDIFGQVSDIFLVGEKNADNDKLVIKVHMFERVELKNGDELVRFPECQFPVRETSQHVYKLLTKNVPLQKACVGVYDHVVDGEVPERFKFFCVLPEVA